MSKIEELIAEIKRIYPDQGIKTVLKKTKTKWYKRSKLENFYEIKNNKGEVEALSEEKLSNLIIGVIKGFNRCLELMVKPLEEELENLKAEQVKKTTKRTTRSVIKKK